MAPCRLHPSNASNPQARLVSFNIEFVIQPFERTNATLEKAVANFFTPTSQKEPDPVSWQVLHESLLIGRFKKSEALQAIKRPQKIAAFDFVGESLESQKPKRCVADPSLTAYRTQDSTLITSRSGVKFAKSSADWKWWHESVPGALQGLKANG